MTVREWQGPVGQWWSRLKDNAPALQEPFVPGGGRSNPSQQEIQAGLVVEWDPRSGTVKGIDQIRPAFVKRDEIAWIGTHRHDPAGNQIYVPSYLFAYGLDLPAGTKSIQLPVERQAPHPGGERRERRPARDARGRAVHGGLCGPADRAAAAGEEIDAHRRAGTMKGMKDMKTVLGNDASLLHCFTVSSGKEIVLEC